MIAAGFNIEEGKWFKTPNGYFSYRSGYEWLKKKDGLCLGSN